MSLVTLRHPDVSEKYLTSQASGEEVPTGHGFDGDPRLALQEAGDEHGLHVVHRTRKAGLIQPQRWGLSQDTLQ